MVFGLAAPVNSGREDGGEDGREVPVMTAEVTFEKEGVAVGPTKSAGKVTPKESAHSLGSSP
jgi:hypothetical protein